MPFLSRRIAVAKPDDRQAKVEIHYSTPANELLELHRAVVSAFVELLSHRDTESGAHPIRMQRFVECLTEMAASSPKFAGKINQQFAEMVICCAPLHDIGKVGLPDHILMKPGKLANDERLVMQTHTIMGAATLERVAQRHGLARSFLQTAIEITRHHHERFDGLGYPDGLVGDAIPLSARIVTIADVYDALRSRRSYKPALTHRMTLQIMTQECAGQFDPDLLRTFERCADKFEQIYWDLAG